MLFTLGQAKTSLRRFVDNGTCRDSVLTDRINEAVSRILDMADWRCCLQIVRISIGAEGMFSLPQGVEKMVDACLDGTPTKIFDGGYQFLSSGPHDLDMSVYSILNEIVDDGLHPVMYDIPGEYTLNDVDYEPEGMKIVALSTVDTTGDIVITGKDADGENISETIQITKWKDGTFGTIDGNTLSAASTSQLFDCITSVSKPATSGYVTLLAYDPATNYYSFLARYHTLPGVMSFRRYKITVPCETGHCVLARVKAGHNSLVDDNDVVPVDSMPAIKAMLMAIRDEDAGNLQMAVQHETNAKRLMEAREHAATVVKGTNIVLDIDYSHSLGNLYPGYII